MTRTTIFRITFLSGGELYEIYAGNVSQGGRGSRK